MSPAPSLVRPPARVLPEPALRELPPPAPLRAMLGPGIVLAGLSIGSGEFVLWPRLTAEWGFAVFWAAWIGVTIQFFLNMEIERYTLATGESAVVGFLRLSRVFGPVFLLCGSLPWIWPGWATGAGTILSWQLGGEPVAWAIGGLVLCGLVLSLGPVVYRTVETLMFVLVTLIFAALVVLGRAWNAARAFATAPTTSATATPADVAAIPGTGTGGGPLFYLVALLAGFLVLLLWARKGAASGRDWRTGA